MKAARVAILVILYVFPLSKNNTAQTSDHGTHADHGQQALQPVPVVPAVMGKEENKEAGKKNQLPLNDTDKWAKWSLYVNAALALATFVLAIYAVKQANAAKFSAEVAANAERSWIITVGVDNPDLQQVWINQVTIHFKVIGNSPLRPLEAKLIYKLVASRPDGHHKEPDFREQPAYGEPLDLTRSPSMGRVYAPEDPMAVTISLESTFLTPADIKALEEGEQFLCVYGFIRYRDAFAATKKRETRFCFVYGNRGSL